VLKTIEKTPVREGVHCDVMWRNTFFRNVGCHSTNDAASHPTRPNPHHSAERTAKGTV